VRIAGAEDTTAAANQRRDEEALSVGRLGYMGRGGGRNGRAVSELESEFGASTRGSRVGRLDFIGPSRPKRNLIKEYLRTAKVSHGKGKDVAIFPDLFIYERDLFHQSFATHYSRSMLMNLLFLF
jgi:hypothetical protein